ncbi:hypothetical protein [Peptacetobacter sp.]|uniref:hypothetical protein n=1 Tax=Peptacetobacter sp. TaxID=2991975 RepID=UPI00262EBB07|nr:hypothetical protein [Peptacetobacter sp.]
MKKITTLLIILTSLISLVGCSGEKDKFIGNRIANNDEFILDYESFNGSNKHNLELKKGDTIESRIDNKKGKIDVKILKEGNKTPIYEGKNIPISKFSVDVDTDGLYEINVIAKKAKGSISFKKIENENRISDKNKKIYVDDEYLDEEDQKDIKELLNMVGIKNNDEIELLVDSDEKIEVKVFKNGGKEKVYKLKFPKAKSDLENGTYRIKINDNNKDDLLSIEKIK